MRKKIFLIGIVVLLLLSSFSTYIFADDVEEKTIEFLINEEEIKEGYNNFVEMNIDIPSGLFEKDIELYKLQKKQKTLDIIQQNFSVLLDAPEINSDLLPAKREPVSVTRDK